MQSAFYVSLSARLALDKRVATIAQNVANLNTVGYRASGVSFESVLARPGATPARYASAGDDYVSRASGELTKTDGPFDVAVAGDGWLALRMPGGVGYTRDGRMQMNESGELTSVLGFPVLDAGLSPIVIDPAAGPPSISRDGAIEQNGRRLGAIGLFSIESDDAMTRGENASVVPARGATPVLDFVRNGVVQGFVESANINPVQELTRLLSAQRAFENMTAAEDMMDGSQRAAVRTLGGG